MKAIDPADTIIMQNIQEDLRRRVIAASAAAGTPIMEWIIEAINEKLAREEEYYPLICLKP